MNVKFYLKVNYLYYWYAPWPFQSSQWSHILKALGILHYPSQCRRNLKWSLGTELFVYFNMVYTALPAKLNMIHICNGLLQFPQITLSVDLHRDGKLLRECLDFVSLRRHTFCNWNISKWIQVNDKAWSDCSAKVYLNDYKGTDFWFKPLERQVTWSRFEMYISVHIKWCDLMRKTFPFRSAAKAAHNMKTL